MIAVDSGYFFALADTKDRHHKAANAFVPTARQGWITTWPVATEASFLLGTRVGESAKQAFLHEILHGSVTIWDIPSRAARAIPALMKTYQNLPMDLADASLVLLAEHLGHGRILTTDQRDFGAYRWKATKPFVDLMAKMPV